MSYERMKSYKSIRQQSAEKLYEEHGERTLKQWNEIVSGRRGNSAKEKVKIAKLIEAHGENTKVKDTWSKK